MSDGTWGPPTCAGCAYWLRVEWLLVDLCRHPETDRLRVDPCAPACERFERRRDGKR